MVGDSSRVGRRLVPLGRGADDRVAEVHRRLQSPAVLPVVPHRVLQFIVSIRSN
jgi:hypothetical protein